MMIARGRFLGGAGTRGPVSDQNGPRETHQPVDLVQSFLPPALASPLSGPVVGWDTAAPLRPTQQGTCETAQPSGLSTSSNEKDPPSDSQAVSGIVHTQNKPELTLEFPLPISHHPTTQNQTKRYEWKRGYRKPVSVRQGSGMMGGSDSPFTWARETCLPAHCLWS